MISTRRFGECADLICIIYKCILLHGKLRERAVCGEFGVLIGYPSVQDGGYYPPGTARFVPANLILPKFKRVHKSSVSPKLFSAKVKRFFVISRSNFRTSLVNNIYLLTKREVKMLGYWPTSLFVFLWTETKSRSIKTRKENEGNTQPS